MSAPPLLLLPGTLCDERLWRPCADRLEAAGHTVLNADLARHDSIADMASDLLALHRGLLVPIGFSMGAIVALEMARQERDRIAALGLVAVNAQADLPERAAARPRQEARAIGGGLDALVRDTLLPAYSLAPRPEAEALVSAMATALGPAAFVRQSIALRTRADLVPLLGSLAMPVLLVAGEHDRLCPPAWHERWRMLIGATARLHVLEETGHMLPIERPEQLATVILELLAAATPC